MVCLGTPPKYSQAYAWQCNQFSDLMLPQTQHKHSSCREEFPQIGKQKIFRRLEFPLISPLPRHLSCLSWFTIIVLDFSLILSKDRKTVYNGMGHAPHWSNWPDILFKPTSGSTPFCISSHCIQAQTDFR